MIVPTRQSPPRGIDRVVALSKYDVDTAWDRWSAENLRAVRCRRAATQWFIGLLVLLALVSIVVGTIGH